MRDAGRGVVGHSLHALKGLKLCCQIGLDLVRSDCMRHEQQRDVLRPMQQAETCVWINSLAQYAFNHVAERLNAAAADGRLEAAINQRLAKKKFPDFVVCRTRATKYLA